MPSTDPSWVSAVADIFAGLGVPPDVWVPILLAESGGNPGAVNDTRGEDTPAGTVPEYSIGLFQVNVHALGLSTDEEEALADRLKDPVENARWHAPAIAAAWNAIGGIVTTEAARNDWAALTAIRSGHPGGNADNPCTSAHCLRVADRIRATASKWLEAIQTSETGLLAPYWNFGKPVGDYLTSALAGAGAASAGIAGAAAAGGMAGGSPIGSVIAGAGASAAGAGGAAAAGAASNVAAVGNALGQWWAKYGARVALFIIGAALLTIAVTSILFEQARTGTKEAIALVKSAEGILE